MSHDAWKVVPTRVLNMRKNKDGVWVLDKSNLFMVFDCTDDMSSALHWAEKILSEAEANGFVSFDEVAHATDRQIDYLLRKAGRSGDPTHPGGSTTLARRRKGHAK